MSVIRVEKTNRFVVMSNQHLRDKSLSLKAKGLLSVALSLPDDWEYSIKGLCAICKESETAISTAIKELKAAGYAEVIKHYPKKGERGNIEYEYVFYENRKQEGEKQGLENLPLESQGLEKNANLNIEESNTENQKRKSKKPIYEHDSYPYKAAKWLAAEIEKRNPEQKKYEEDDLQRWANEFRLMQQYDVSDWGLISKVLAFSQDDMFWQDNILSAKKFREKFQTLLGKAKKAGYV